MDQSFSWPILGASCASAFLIYLADRVWFNREEDKINDPERRVWYSLHPHFAWIAGAVALIVILLCIPFLPITAIGVGIVLGFGALLYLKVEGPGAIPLKGHWLIKPLAISVCWGFGGVVFPVIALGESVDTSVVGLFLYRVPLILSNVLLADWPDRAGDMAFELRTLAVLLEPQDLRSLAGGLAGLSLLLGSAYGLWMAWPAPFYVDLLGPILMVVLALRMFEFSRQTLGFTADLIVAWPLVTALFISI